MPTKFKLTKTRSKKTLLGVDVFLHWDNGTPDDLGKQLEKLTGDDLTLTMVSNRGVKVYPNGHPETFCVDHWRCRFLHKNFKEMTPISHQHVIDLLSRVNAAGLDFIKTEHLCAFDGERGYSLGQGE